MPSYAYRDDLIKKCRAHGRELSKEHREFLTSSCCPFCGTKHSHYVHKLVLPNGDGPRGIHFLWNLDINILAECKECHKKWNMFDVSQKPDKNSYISTLRTVNQSFFSRDEISIWRSFSGLNGWAIGEVEGFPNEARLFDAPINDSNVAPSIRLVRLVGKNFDFTRGWLMASDRRLMVTNSVTKDVFDILYSDIVAAYNQQEIVKLVLLDKSNILIYTKFPTVSLLNAVAMMGQPIADATIMAAIERQKQAIGLNFISSFTEFFNSIADKNRK